MTTARFLLNLSRDERATVLQYVKKQLPILLKEFEQKLHRRIDPFIAFAEKMNRGSIVDTHQVIMVSKQRIITPTKRSDNLYDICIPPEIMSDISKMISQNYIEVERLDKSSQKV